MNDEDLINDLILWSKDKKNSMAKLAVKLGYKSSTAINMWLKRGKIPEWQQRKVANIIKAKGA